MTEKLKRKHSLLNDAQGNPISPRAAAKFLTSKPRGSAGTATRESQAGLLKMIEKNLGELETFASTLPRGSARQRSLIKYIAELRLEVQSRERFIR